MGNYTKNNLEYFPESKTAGIIKLILFVFVIILIIITIILLMNMDIFPQKNVKLNASIQNIPQYKNSSSGAIQFYPNMKFNHNNLSYNIEVNCNSDERARIVKAFDLISNEVSSINFFENTGESDIDVMCSEEEKYNSDLSSQNKEFFIAGEGGSKEIIQTARYNVINKGVILLYGNPQNSLECDWPNTEVHELMHVFGFNHSSDKNSLMYPYLENCNQKLDESIINILKTLYSEENLVDLYFENISANKKGRYLDFNFTIKNSGDIDAENVSYSVIDDSQVVETKEIDDIRYGAGIIIGVTNFKLLHRNSKEIKIVIDYYKSIKEIDKENNIALFKFE